MCCSPEHYPKDVGIWLTDETGRHVHYGEEIEGPCPGTYYTHHWHSLTPGRITACVTRESSILRLRGHDWQRSDRELSMGSYKALDNIDFDATLTFTTSLASLKGRDLILVAIAEGYDWTRKSLEELLPNADIIFRHSRDIIRPDPPDYETWLRWGAFTKPAYNEKIYQADFRPGRKFH